MRSEWNTMLHQCFPDYVKAKSRGWQASHDDVPAIESPEIKSDDAIVHAIESPEIKSEEWSVVLLRPQLSLFSCRFLLVISFPSCQLPVHQLFMYSFFRFYFVFILEHILLPTYTFTCLHCCDAPMYCLSWCLAKRILPKTGVHCKPS